jgi:hypothetical protein
MVVDLVMSERERLSRIRLVGQNRELRQQQQGAMESPTREDREVIKLVTRLHSQLLTSTQGKINSREDREVIQLVTRLHSRLLTSTKAVNPEDKRSRRYRDRHFTKFERSRRYRDRYRC